MTFTVPTQLGQQARLYFEVRDSDLTNDDVVASGFANLLGGGFLTPGIPQTYNINLFYNGNPAGILQIVTQYAQWMIKYCKFRKLCKFRYKILIKKLRLRFISLFVFMILFLC